MNALMVLRVALNALRVNKLRSSLTMQQVSAGYEGPPDFSITLKLLAFVWVNDVTPIAADHDGTLINDVLVEPNAAHLGAPTAGRHRL